MSLRCLLWGSGTTFYQYYHTIRSYESLGEILVCGVTSNDPIYSEIGGYSFIRKNEINNNDFDIVIVMSINDSVIADIRNEAISMGIPERMIIPCKVMSMLDFDLTKYLMLKENPITIFAPNCWGGLTYNRLGFRFDSPLINMFEDHGDYLKFLENPKQYLEYDLNLREMRWEGNLKREYPIVECGDILLHFNHYISFEEAQRCWNKRKERIHWNNIFVMLYDENPHRVEIFMNLPYKRKICFVPYYSDKQGVVSVEYKENNIVGELPFWKIVNGMASGKWHYYDALSLLLDGEVKLIAKFRK